MSEQVKESLSVLMDGEASELDIARVLKHSGDRELRQTWMRYHGARAAIQDSSTAHRMDIDVSAAVMAAIEGDDGRAGGRWRGALKPLASFAVAASVFASVLVGGQFYGLVGEEPELDQSLAGGVSTVGMVNVLGGSAVRAGFASPNVAASGAVNTTDYDRLARERLSRYMLTHTERAALNLPQGMMPYARVASFQVEE